MLGSRQCSDAATNHANVDLESSAVRPSNVIEPESIQKVVQQVMQGHMTSQQAAESLIDDSPTTSLASVEEEPLVDLIQRFGPPPDDIAQAWCDQLRALLSKADAVVDDSDVSLFGVGSDGRLRLIESLATETTSTSDSESTPRDIESIIDSFRRQGRFQAERLFRSPNVFPIHA